MSVEQLRPFPSHFRLKDLAAITGRVFELKLNPNEKEAARTTYAWFDSRNVYHGLKKKKFLSHRFDSYAGMSFPDADVSHLETCIAFFLWAFSFDDLSDEGALQSKPEAHQVGVDISMEVLRNPEAPPPNFPYAAMLHDIWRRFRLTASPGACNRFFRAVESWMNSQVEQARNRATDEIPSVEEFIVLRRRTIGGPIVEAMVEYSLDLQIPEYVWDDPVLQEMSKAVIDIMTWPNDLCSFNKEQADGDFQNLVFCIMIERDCDLQTAVDVLTDMLAQRVADYERYKAQLPSFGPEVDAELARYNRAIEQYTQGTVVWYYYSPRYFRGQEVTGIPEVVVPVYERTTPAPEEPMASFKSSQHALVTSSGSKSVEPLSLRLPRSATLPYHARLSLLLISLAACILYFSFTSFPDTTLKFRVSVQH
ncbi:terpenoid synthase [Dichomitus squalens]|uniref:Terpene synthase n=2 Tax=Dichomitus squalens TaxID=114155 RepID=A0A4Q9PN74_9APHY|nr:terpenoid synthase [Dichomitus squalens LYAD-421 SS1]EJF60235.1 terpenoid synthase [Dichomitus squalens LYAD-421 SS1]TBU41112.1 terpenoid synthase [Dichomitus squalens]TBU55707.1 terpenoid synthase [Dichomitus squalens]